MTLVVTRMCVCVCFGRKAQTPDISSRSILPTNPSLSATFAARNVPSEPKRTAWDTGEWYRWGPGRDRLESVKIRKVIKSAQNHKANMKDRNTMYKKKIQFICGYYGYPLSFHYHTNFTQGWFIIRLISLDALKSLFKLVFLSSSHSIRYKIIFSVIKKTSLPLLMCRVWWDRWRQVCVWERERNKSRIM